MVEPTPETTALRNKGNEQLLLLTKYSGGHRAQKGSATCPRPCNEDGAELGHTPVADPPVLTHSQGGPAGLPPTLLFIAYPCCPFSPRERNIIPTFAFLVVVASGLKM